MATSLPTRRAARALVGAALAAIVLAGCGSGFQAQTNQIYQPGPGMSDRSSQVFAINTLIVTNGQGNGTLVTALINQAEEPDTLTGVIVTGPKGHAYTSKILSGTIALPPHRAVQLADTGDVRVNGMLPAGSNYTVKLTFAHAAPVTTQLPIVLNTNEFADVPVGPIPPPSTPSHSNPTK